MKCLNKYMKLETVILSKATQTQKGKRCKLSSSVNISFESPGMFHKWMLMKARKLLKGNGRKSFTEMGDRRQWYSQHWTEFLEFSGREGGGTIRPRRSRAWWEKLQRQLTQASGNHTEYGLTAGELDPLNVCDRYIAWSIGGWETLAVTLGPIPSAWRAFWGPFPVMGYLAQPGYAKGWSGAWICLKSVLLPK